MHDHNESDAERLWKHYAATFREFDDLMLARWMSQTLGQLQGKVWRLSHPLVATYRLVSQVSHERQIWLKRLTSMPAAYVESPCCRAPNLPLFTRDILEEGLLCAHCDEVLVSFDQMPEALRPAVASWARDYDAIHQVAHWDKEKQARIFSYEKAMEEAACNAERMLLQALQSLMPEFLNYYPAVLFEDHDECLDVRPEDVLPQT